MKVEIHKLFDYLLETTTATPEAVVGYSLSSPPRLGDFLDDLDPDMPLDWNNRDFMGLPELREHVRYHCGLQDRCSTEDILITAGAAEANFLAISQLLQPGDELVTEQPGWPQAAVLAQAKGCTVRTVRRREAEGWSLPLQEVADAVNGRTRVIFLSNPNNPTGRKLGASELDDIAGIADRVGAWLIVDEVYAGLEWTGERAPSIAGLYSRGITTGSVSKALGLQGLRTGWLICRAPELIRDAFILRENSSEIMNIMGERIAEVALRPKRYEAALAGARAEGLENLEVLNQFVTDEPKLSWQRPEAGLIGLARLHCAIDGEAFARRLLAEPYKTFLIPGSAYGEDRHIRLGVGGGTSVRLDTGLDRMRQLLATL